MMRHHAKAGFALAHAGSMSRGIHAVLSGLRLATQVLFHASMVAGFAGVVWLALQIGF